MTIALAGVLLSGCGAGRPTQRAVARVGSSDVARSVIAAAQRTLSLTATVDFRLDGARDFGAARAPVFGRASFDFRSGSGAETLDLPEAAHQEFGNEHAILFPTRVYLQPKATNATVLPRGKLWMSATIAGSESVNTNFPQFVGAVEGINPMLGLAELAGGAMNARPLGEQLVDRAPAERYAVDVDLERALSGLARTAAPALGAAIQQELATLPSRSPASGRAVVSFHVWIDRAGRVVEYRAELPGTGDGTALVQMRSFGAAVRVGAPAASQVVDITALTPSGERENNGGGDSDGG